MSFPISRMKMTLANFVDEEFGYLGTFELKNCSSGETLIMPVASSEECWLYCVYNISSCTAYSFNLNSCRTTSCQKISVMQSPSAYALVRGMSKLYIFVSCSP